MVGLIAETISRVAFALFFQPSFLEWMSKSTHNNDAFNSFSNTLIIAGTTYYQSLFFTLILIIGLLLSSIPPIRRGVGILALKFRHNKLMEYQEHRHFLHLTLTTVIVAGLGTTLLSITLPSVIIWEALTPYYLGYFAIFVSILIYNIDSNPDHESVLCSLSSNWLTTATPALLAIVLLSQLWGTTPFIWIFILFAKVLRLPTAVSIYYAIAGVIAYYTFYLLYAIIFLDHGFLGFSILQVVIILLSVIVITVALHVLTSFKKAAVLSLLCFYLGVGYLLWV